MSWQPIATAPQDGSWIVVRRAGDSDDVGCYRFAHGGWVDIYEEPFVAVDGSYDMTLFYTHWAPVPDVS